jgi:hypothetical protein
VRIAAVERRDANSIERVRRYPWQKSRIARAARASVEAHASDARSETAAARHGAEGDDSRDGGSPEDDARDERRLLSSLR